MDEKLQRMLAEDLDRIGMNRYQNGAAYVSPIAPGTPQAIQILPPDSLQQSDISAVWTPTISQSRDSTGAQDRARGLILRTMPTLGALVFLASTAVIMYLAGLAVFDLRPLSSKPLDSTLIFLGILGAMWFFTYSAESRRDYQHSHAGVERHRLDAAADIRMAELGAELQMRREALAASLKLLEIRTDADDR